MEGREESLVREAIAILQMITIEMPRQLQDAYRRKAITILNQAIEDSRRG